MKLIPLTHRALLTVIRSSARGPRLSSAAAVSYYPQRPWEECRAYAPTLPPPDAPAMPAGTRLGSPTVDEVNQNPALYLDLCLPAAPGTAFGETLPPWVIFINEQANITSQPPGRFSCEYADPDALCPGDDFVEDTP